MLIYFHLHIIMVLYFFSQSFSCRLKGNPNEMVMKAKRGVTSGIPGRGCQLDYCMYNWRKEIPTGFRNQWDFVILMSRSIDIVGSPESGEVEMFPIITIKWTKLELLF